MSTLIGILTLNGAGRLERLLDSILQYTDLGVYNAHIVIVNDGSNDEQSELIREIVHVRNNRELSKGRFLLLENEENKGIAYSWNRAAQSILDDSVIVLLNDDVEVVPHWLDALHYTITKNDHLGMVGLDFVNNVCSQNPHTHGRNFLPQPNFIVATPLTGEKGLLASNGVVFGFARKKFYEVGRFDERFFNFFEELDFGVALASRQYVNCILSAPLLYHLGGATFAANFPNAGAIMQESREKFRDKWGATLAELYEKLLPSPHLHTPVHVWNSHLSYIGVK